MHRLTRTLLALLALALLAPAGAPVAPAAAQPDPPALRADLAPPRPPQNDAAARPDQVSTCRQALSDPTVSEPGSASPWKVYRPAVEIGRDAVLDSQALFFLENTDGAPASGPDVDAAGQPFGPIPATLSELAGSLTFRYEAGTTAPGDLLRVEIYQEASPAPAGLLGRRDLDVGALDTGQPQIFEWEFLDQATLATLRGRATAVFVVSMVSGSGASTQQLWADDLTANLCVQGASVGGQVFKGAEPATGADVLLVRIDAAGERVVAAARTAADGSYTFGAVPALPQGVSYRLWYLNTSATSERDDTRLGFWAGPTITALAEGQQLVAPAMNVADAPLTSPAPYDRVVMTAAQPAVLSWTPRGGAPTERYSLCIYDPERAGATGLPAQLCSPPAAAATGAMQVSVRPADFAAAPGFSFAYGRTYRWYVVVYADPAASAGQPYGYSFFERAITFLPEPSPAPPAEPALRAGDPAAGVAGATWTLLVYVAADNALGDEARAPRMARPTTQLAGAAAAAAASPKVNIVSYVDGYGGGGARLCAYPPGRAPDCVARPEPNTALPADLGAFIKTGRERYPAARTALLVISPGSATGELATDESAGGGTLRLQQLREAYAAGLGADAKLDLVIYQAPNLGTVDALRATEPYARYAVAAADQIWQSGALAQLVPMLDSAGTGDPSVAARGAVTTYRAVADAMVPGSAVSIAAYDLGRLQAVALAVDDLAFVIGEALSTNRAALVPALEAAVGAAQPHDSSGNGRHDALIAAGGPVAADEDTLVDLTGLATALRDTPGVPGTVIDEARDLLRLLTDPTTAPVISSVQRSGTGIAGAQVSLDGASGLAIFFPGGQRLGGTPALSHAYLYGPSGGPPRDGDWATMLRAYLQTVIGGGPGGVTASPAGGAQLRPGPGGLLRTDVSLPLVRR